MTHTRAPRRRRPLTTGARTNRFQRGISQRTKGITMRYLIVSLSARGKYHVTRARTDAEMQAIVGRLRREDAADITAIRDGVLGKHIVNL